MDIQLAIVFVLPPTSNVLYSLFVNNHTGGCGGPEGLNEGIEFAMRINASGMYGPWIPLRWTWRGKNNKKKVIRGYRVDTHGMTPPIATQQVTICEGDLLPVDASGLQFRWMNTASQPGRFDMWALFNVTADVVHASAGDTYRIFDSE